MPNKKSHNQSKVFRVAGNMEENTEVRFLSHKEAKQLLEKVRLKYRKAFEILKYR